MLPSVFAQVQVREQVERSNIPADLDAILLPYVADVEYSVPRVSKAKVYEVWIKYNLDIESVSGDPIDSWFMPVYGKTPDSFMISRSDAIEEATIVALRDAGAKLLLDFFRIPSVYSWIEQQQNL